jgi:hypothetical protein
MDVAALRCDTQEWPGCKLLAAISWVCVREGRQVRLCHACDKAWKEHARGNPALMVSCPNCSKNLPETALPRDEGMHDLLGTYYSVAFDKAMHKAGVLEPIRKTVIQILDTDLSIWTEAEKASPLTVEARAGADASG